MAKRVDARGCVVSRKNKGLTTTGVPLNFLLGCSERDLGSFELARLSQVANLRSELHVILDRLIDEMAQAALAGWFRVTDRNALKRAIENPEDILGWAKERIRNKGKSEKEIAGELVPRALLPPGSAHIAAALRYQENHIAQGLCAVCPLPLARNSVRFCEKHLAMARSRMRQKKGLRSDPGSREYLYSGELTESTHGRQPGTLASLAMNREKKTRALLADLGMPPGSAAVSLKASIEALVKCMPRSKHHALTQAELFEKASIPSKTTGQKALQQLLSAQRIQRIGKGAKGNPFRYFAGSLTVFGVSTKTLVG
ncbi:MAG: hypothetical protein ACHQLQ_01790 [Candidatus Acidiferrales bacterium]